MCSTADSCALACPSRVLRARSLASEVDCAWVRHGPWKCGITCCAISSSDRRVAAGFAHSAGGGSIHEYAARLLRTIGFPRYVLPTHWDDFDYPLDEPARDWGGLAALRTAVAQASPSSPFAVVDHLQTFVP